MKIFRDQFLFLILMKLSIKSHEHGTIDAAAGMKMDMTKTKQFILIPYELKILPTVRLS